MNTGIIEKLENELRISCDWMSFTITGLSDVLDVLKFLGYDEESYIEMPKGGMGYKKMIRIKGYSISILYDGNADMGIFVTCSGSSILELIRSYGESRAVDTPFGEKGWEFDNALVDFINSVQEIGHFSRFDIALDDIGSRFYNLDELDNLVMGKVDGKRVVSKFKQYERKHPVNIFTHKALGDTCYFGSRRSEVFMRVYDKRLEQEHKTKQDLGVDWVRWEVEFKGERAQQVANMIAKTNNMASVFVGVLNNYFCIKNLDDSNISRCSLDEKWSAFVCDMEKLRLYVADAEKTLEEKENWFKMQVAPTLAGIIVANEGDMSIIYDFFDAYLTRMSRDMQRICDVYNPTWRSDWGLDNEFVA